MVIPKKLKILNLLLSINNVNNYFENRFPA